MHGQGSINIALQSTPRRLATSGHFALYSVKYIEGQRDLLTLRAPLQVSRITGDVAPAGDAIHLRIEADAHASDILLLPTDVGGLVNMLLALVSAASDPRSELVDGQRPAALPLPAAA